LFVLPAAGQSRNLTPLPADAPVLLFNIKDTVPKGAVPVGKIAVIDPGLKFNCGLQKTVDEARVRARARGANVIKITKLKSPDGWSSCYRLWADVYTLENIQPWLDKRVALADSITSLLIDDTAQYALLMLYRPADNIGTAIHYQVNLGDSAIGRMHYNSKLAVRVYKEGPVHLWGQTEARRGIDLDIQFGKVYFVHCSLGMGVWVGQPSFSLVTMLKGYLEYREARGRTPEEDAWGAGR
jgi:hypothetical protein